jgi:hypothetical protein
VDILIGLLAILAGVAICFSGLRVFFVLLPILGFIVGFLAGAALMSAIFGDDFLGTALGIIVGLVFGVLFGITSYLWWYIAVILSAGAAGAAFTASLLFAVGMDTDWLVWLIAIAVGALFMLAAFVIAYPVWWVVFVTAFNGAALVLAGILLVFNQMDREDIGTAALWQRLDDNWFLWLIWFALALAGVVGQFKLMARVVLPDDRWEHAPVRGTAV